MRTPYLVSNFLVGLSGIFGAFLLFGIPAAATAADVVTPQTIQGYIAHADPAKALSVLAPILKADPHSAKAWYLEAEALDALGHDHKAKVALGTAEHLSPAMPFANPRSLSGLEHRVGLSNVQASRSRSELFDGLLWLLLLALLVGAGVYAYFRSGRRKIESAAESARQNVLLAITQFLTGDIDAARISADARGDAVRLASIQGWQQSLVDCARGLKDVANADLDLKLAVTKRCDHLLTEIRAEMVGQAAIQPVSGGGNQGDGLEGLWPDNSAIVAERRGIAPANPVHTAPSQTLIYQSGNTGGGGAFDSALEEGLGMGIGMEIAEDLISGNRNSFGSDQLRSDPSGSNGDGFSGDNDGLSSRGGDGFGDADDGLSSNDSGGDDDGFTDSSDSW
ncbi:hypothetical protein A4H96_01185 [Acidithiobacillus ferrooxidans]|uniref:Tetratricopeptide repeat protein n=2 Tax=Acidithiobacillus TaxID=119977 RepID=A0A179BNN6_ACIFR|nr:hypothetical protein A4H96_01185 [Acidithiobacillus ferrooxidans]